MQLDKLEQKTSLVAVFTENLLPFDSLFSSFFRSAAGLYGLAPFCKAFVTKSSRNERVESTWKQKTNSPL